MFLCRVAVGEFCLGHNGQLTPDVRDSSRNVLYDTTTDSMDESKRNMFVVYHDAQAYPEYLLEYSMSNWESWFLWNEAFCWPLNQPEKKKRQIN